MDQDPDIRKHNTGRESALTFTLVAVLGGAFVFFLNMVSLGVFFYVVAAIFGMVAIGYVHYVLWGHSMSQDVAGEREEELLKQRRDDRD